MVNAQKLRFGLTVMFTLCLSCREIPDNQCTSETVSFTVTDAREIFSHTSAVTRTSTPDLELPSLGTIEPQWSQAKPSQNYYAASIDVPILTNLSYQIQHLLPDGTTMWQFLYPKLVVLQGRETEGNDCYIAFYIPDCNPQKPSSEDVGACYLNSLPKTGFTGRILFTTLEGIPVAAARYVKGEQAASAFLWDFDTTNAYLKALFATIDQIVLRRLPKETTRGINDINPIPEVVVIAVNRGWQKVLDSIHDKTESYDHINPSTGSGGGGSGSSSNGSKNPDTDSDDPGHHTSIVTDNEEVDRLLKKLKLDCMGGTLIGALDYDIKIVTGDGNNRFTYKESYSGNTLVAQSGTIEITKWWIISCLKS